MTSVRQIRLEPNRTYPWITSDGIKEMTPAEAESYKGCDPFRHMVADRIRAMALQSGCAGSGDSTMRWNRTKKLLYEMLHGEFQLNEKEHTKKTKYLSLDLTTFEYESLTDGDLLTIYEMVCRRLYIQM